MKTVIKVTGYRHINKGAYLFISRSTTVRDYISSPEKSAATLAQRIREYWHVENQVHYVRDVTQGENDSMIRVQSLPKLLVLARTLALNLYRDHGFVNMAQAQRKAG